MTDNMNELSERLLSATIGDRSAEVSFRGQGLKLDTEQDAKDVVEAISRCPDLETLCLEGNTLGVDAAKAVGKALEAQPKLRRALWKDLFTGRSKEVIPDALRFLTGGVMLSHARLTELDLSDNAFGPVGIGALVPLLSSPCCFQLKTLLLNNNGLGPGGAELLAKALGACLAESRKAGTPLQLRTLVCGRNRLENVGATALAAVLADMGSLEELSLPQNGIFHEGVGALAKGVAANPNLHLLNLNDNIFTPEGARQMAQAVRRLDKLEVLNFGDCLVKTAGAKALAKGLAGGSSPLREVQLGYNGISLSGGLALVEVLKDRPQLEVLELDGNKFGAHGVEQLEAAMDVVGKLDKLCAFSDDEGSSADEDDEDEEARDAEEEQRGSVEAFLASPTAPKLVQLGSQRSKQLLQHIEENSGQNLLCGYLDAFMKVASVVGLGDEASRRSALDCGDALMGASFALASREGGPADLNNRLLVRLGLLKAERGEESTWPGSTKEGAMSLLADLVPKEYFDSSTRDALQAFLSRPQQNGALESKARHRLMQVLYQA
uniref:Putative ran gtpase-activating protein n=1 Tax=Ixodes ricinus TaxID=34613 RepID=A0A131XZ83_IXORI